MQNQLPYQYEIAPGYSVQGFANDSDLRSTLAALFDRKWLILFAALVGTSLAVLVGLQRPDRYEATALLLLDPQKQNIIESELVSGDQVADQSMLMSHRSVLSSPEFVGTVVDTLALAEDADFNGKVDLESPPLFSLQGMYLAAANIVGPERLESIGILGQSDAPGDAATGLTASDHLRTSALKSFLSRYSVQQEGRSLVLRIKFVSDDPRKAARIANATADRYVQLIGEERTRNTAAANMWLSQRVNELKKEVEDGETKILDHLADRDERAIEASIAMDEQRQIIQHSLLQLSAEEATKGAQFDRLKKIAQDGDQWQVVTELVDSEVVTNLRAQRIDLDRRIAELDTRFAEDHPYFAQISADQASLERLLNESIDGAFGRLQSEIDDVRARSDALVEERLRLEDQLAGVRSNEFELRELERQSLASRQLYEQFLARLNEVRYQRGLESSEIRKVARATTPTEPVGNNLKIIALLGFVASVGASSGLVVLQSRLKSSVTSASQIEHKFGQMVSGIVPTIPQVKSPKTLLRALKMQPNSAYSEAIQSICAIAGLVENHERKALVFGVTSAIAGEGKTLLTLSKAVVLSTLGLKVLLIDGDLRRKTLSRGLGLGNSRGLSDLIEESDAEDEEIINDIDLENVDLISAGTCPMPPMSVMSSPSVSHFIEAARSHYDVILIDSAPVGLAMDIALLSKSLDGMIFAVKWNETPIETVNTAIKKLSSKTDVPTNFALTQVNFERYARYGYSEGAQHYRGYTSYYGS